MCNLYSITINQAAIIALFRKKLLDADDGGRSVLIYGPAGCGKSSIAETYAAALLCTGSEKRPCVSERCDSCRIVWKGNHPNLRLLRHASVTDVQFAEQVSEDILTETFGNGRLVIFIDHAQLMSARALDILHEQISGPPERVTYILCADDPTQFRAKTQTLFYPLPVKRPDLVTAVKYMEWLCQRERFTFEINALEMLAEYFPPIPPHHRSGTEKSVSGPPPQPSMPAIRQAILDLFVRPPPLRCTHCERLIARRPQLNLPK